MFSYDPFKDPVLTYLGKVRGQDRFRYCIETHSGGSRLDFASADPIKKASIEMFSYIDLDRVLLDPYLSDIFELPIRVPKKTTGLLAQYIVWFCEKQR